MKNQYFGDVNDYVKYGLLRVLTRVSGLRAGVVWMLTPDDDRPDGARIAYHKDPGWREHDPELFDRLARLVSQPGVRSIELFRRWDLVPRSLDFDLPVPEGSEARADWMAAARESLKTCPLLFFDPDNGFEVESVPPGRRDSNRYLYWNETAAAWRAGHSLLVYQHFPREDRDHFETGLVDRVRGHLPGAQVSALRSAHVVFLLAAQPGHAEDLARAAGEVVVRWAGRVSVSNAAVRADRAGDLAAVCEMFSQAGPARAAETLALRYPFDPAGARKRVYTELEALGVWVRDGFIDRWDGARLVFPGTLRVLSVLLPDAFPYHPDWKVSEAHPAYGSLSPTLDHIVPVASGGPDEPENWVTTSQRNNSAKAHWTPDELGWPLRPPGTLAEWDGLTRWFRSTVAAKPELLEHEPVRRWSALLDQVLPRI